MRRFILLAFSAMLATACPGSVGKPTAAIAPLTPVHAGTIVRLDGTQSADPQNRPLVFGWSILALPAGSRAQLNDAASQTPSFTADVPGDYVVQLVVSNGILASDGARVTLTASACGANAPRIQTVGATPAGGSVGTTIVLGAEVLDGDTAPECALVDPLDYEWTLVSQPPGSLAALNNRSSRAPSFLADAAGTFVFRLSVVDSHGLEAPPVEQTVVITACGTATPTIETLSADPATPNAGQTVGLQATVADSDIVDCTLVQSLSYRWSLVARPPGSSANLRMPDSETPLLDTDQVGAYQVRLVVVDSTGRESLPKYLDVVTTQCGTASPTLTASASSPNPNPGSPVTLTATAADVDNDAPCSAQQQFRYFWTVLVRPAASNAVLPEPASASPVFVPDVAGAYQLQVIATDSTGRASAPAFVTVQTSQCGSAVPRVVATTSLANPNPGQRVDLLATPLDDDNGASCLAGQTFSTLWSIEGRPLGSTALLSNPSEAAPSFTPDLPGGYQLRVVATDSTGRASAPAFVTLSATACGTSAPSVAATSTATAPNPGQTVTLTAVATDADNGTACKASQTFGYTWSVLSRPAGSASVLASPTASSSTFVPDLPGSYQLQVFATDSTGRSSPDAFVTLTATRCGTAAPSVTATASTNSPNPQQTVTLTATATDADNATGCGAGQTFTYLWSVLSRPFGSASVPSNPAAATPSFRPDLAGSYQLQVVATDSTGRASSPAFLTLTASGCGTAAPTVAASTSNVAPATGTEVTLTATGTDADNAVGCAASQTLTYLWSLVARPPTSTALPATPASASTRFTPDVAGSYQLQVVATDSTGRASPPAVVSLATPIGCGEQAPVVSATAAPAASPNLGQTVTLGATITDPDNATPCSRGQTFTYQWQLVSRPQGSAAVLSDPGAAAPTFTPDVSGAYQVQLVATDSTGRASAPDFVTLSTSTCGAARPSATIAATPAAPLVGASVQVTATVSDPDNTAPCSAGQTFTYQWTLVSRPNGSASFLSNPVATNPTFVPDVHGSYQLGLVVSDSTGRSSSLASLVVTTDVCGSRTPTAQIGVLVPVAVAAPAASLLVPPGSLVQLDGASSSDPDAAAPCNRPELLSYAWQLIGMPAGATAQLNDPAAATPSLRVDTAGTYVVSLTVEDAAGHRSAPATLTLTAGATAFALDRSNSAFTATAVDANGNPVVAWLDNNAGSLRVARCTGGCATGNPLWQVLSPDPDSGLGTMAFASGDEPRPIDVKVGSGGQIFVAYHSQTRCAAKVAVFDGTAWQTPKVVDEGTGCNPAGTAGTDRGRWLSLALTPAGSPALAYSNRDLTLAGSFGVVRYATCTGSCTTSAPTWSSSVNVQPATPGTYVGKWATLRFNSSGDGRIATYNDNGSLWYTECSGANCNNSPWPVRTAVDNIGDVGRYASLALTPTGQPRIAYRDQTHQDLKFASCTASCAASIGNWTRTVAAGDATADVGSHLSLAVDVGGNPRIVTRHEGTGRLWYLVWSRGAFVPTSLEAVADARALSLAVTAAGSPRISYFDPSDSVVKATLFGP